MEEGFRSFLKKGRRSENAIERVVAYVREFEEYLKKHRRIGLNEADIESLEAFTAWIEQEPKASARGHLWGIAYYYEYISNDEMQHWARELRGQRLERHPFPLREFLGIDPELAALFVLSSPEMARLRFLPRGTLRLPGYFWGRLGGGVFPRAVTSATAP